MLAENGQTVYDRDEVKELYGWNYQNLYYFQEKGFLTKPLKFDGDVRKYWPKEELDRLKGQLDTLENQTGTAKGEKTLFTQEEVLELYGWTYDQLYFNERKGLLSKPIKFPGKRRAYWPKAELDRLKTLDKSETSKPGFKGNPAVPHIFTDPEAARQMLVNITNITR